MNVLDLFSGLEGWSGPWRELGHNVYRVEIDPKFPAEHRDIMTFEPEFLPWMPDIILASPPCTWFTVMQIGRNWTKDHQPTKDRRCKARLDARREDDRGYQHYKAQVLHH